jgi:membrane fusion protein (multidrug efflux system)
MLERMPVKTVFAQQRDLELTLPVFGAISYLEKVEVASEVAGLLKDVRVEPGDLVRQGQVLAVLDTDLLKAELAAKAAMQEQAAAQLQLAQWQYQAQRKLYKVGGASLNALEEAESRYHDRRAEAARYQAESFRTRTMIDKSTIRAPIAAMVGQKNYNLGERVPTLGTQGERGIVTLMRLDEVYGQAEISEREMARLRPALEVLVFPDAYPGKRLVGKIDRLEPVLREESRTVIAKVRIANPDLLLKPGMFSRMEIVLDKIPQVVAVPKAALQVGPDKAAYVFVVLDEVAFLRKVVPGMATENLVEIKEGLKAGEAVVVEGAERLKDLARVVSQPVGAER